MTGPNICVYAIAHNERQHVDRFMASCAGADTVVVVDTGSTDGTADRAREHGAIVHRIAVRPWRFDVARNAAMALLPADADICISLDLDEVLVEAWRPLVEAAWRGATTRLYYLYDWGAGITYYYDKIHARWGYRWHHPVHEALRPDGRITEVWGTVDGLLVRHLPDATKSRGQYMDLLELSVAEDPSCPRNAFYYARELTFHRRWKEAARALRRYLDHPAATNRNERCYAMRLLGKAQQELGRWDDAFSWLTRAVAEAPATREPWVDLADHHRLREQWPLSRAAAEQALRIDRREHLYMNDPEAWGAKPHDLLALAAWNLGDVETAQRHGRIAVGLAPHDVRLSSNLGFYEGTRSTAA